MNKEIKLYRHKTYKEIYLIRNWSICGGSPDTDWFEATTSFHKAIGNLWRYDNKINDYYTTDLDKEIKEHFYENGHSLLKAKVKVYKAMEFDGYIGKLEKELILPVDEFEPYILKGNE